jgi:acetolactate synthase I/II/III large subunit
MSDASLYIVKISDFVINAFVSFGIDSAFSVTGGAAMHLNDSAGENSALQVMYMHNEQSCAMAAEGYARIARKPALVIVTAGPGAINAFNGVFGAFTDSIPMIVISGQARKNTQKSHFGLMNLRQLGDQEAPILNMVKEITKKVYEITAEMQGLEIAEVITDALAEATSGRPGPVWIEIPVDVQALQIEPVSVEAPKVRQFKEPEAEAEKSLSLLLNKLSTSKRPVLLLGSGIQISNSQQQAISFAQKHKIPILTAWSHDVISSDHPLFFGRPGTIGTRPGNMILQNSDLLLVLGSRLNIRQISYNYDGFAPHAYKIQVDIDGEEFNKPFPRIDLSIRMDLRDFFESLARLTLREISLEDHTNWILWCQSVNEKYSVKDSDYVIKADSINAYHLIPELIRQAPSNSVLACGDATACIVPFQTAHLKDGMNMFSNSGCASMGYDLPAALGAAIADSSRPVICFAGDGSIMMNIQELQTLAASKLNVLVVILDNGGYLSIKQTQTNFFGRFHGSNPLSGVSFPNFVRVAEAFGLPTTELDPVNWRTDLIEVLNSHGPRVVVAKLDQDQEFEPRLKSRMVDGLIQTPSLEDMYPHLDGGELSAIMGRFSK